MTEITLENTEHEVKEKALLFWALLLRKRTIHQFYEETHEPSNHDGTLVIPIVRFYAKFIDFLSF